METAPNYHVLEPAGDLEITFIIDLRLGLRESQLGVADSRANPGLARRREFAWNARGTILRKPHAYAGIRR